MILYPSKIKQKRPQIDENTSWERFRRQIVTRSAPGRSQLDGLLDLLCLFGLRLRSKEPIWDYLGSQNAFKIAQLSLGRHLDPPKMFSTRGVGKTCKFNEKSKRESKVFDDSEPRLALYSSLITHFRNFLKKNEKPMPKGMPKVLFFVQKQTLGGLGLMDSAILVDF